MTRLALRAIAASMALLLGGCAAIQSTEEVVLNYNRAFANSRNEMLVLNILRSAAREPMQFSTMGTVTGQVGNGGSLTIPFTNLIAGGRNVISPSLVINDAVNPNITITPLGAREFATAIMTPITADRIQLFLNGGWDAEFMLPLIIEGVECPDRRFLANSGLYEVDGSTAVNDAFRDFFQASARHFAIESAPGQGNPQVFTIGDERAIALLRDGLGANLIVESVEDEGPGTKRVTIRPARRTVFLGLDIETLCERLSNSTEAGSPQSLRDTAMPDSLRNTATVASGGGRIILRSVQTMIYYLGESHRVRFNRSTRYPRGLTYYGPHDRRAQTLFKLEWGPSTSPPAVATQFQGTRFYVPRLNLGAAEGTDRTLKTLSFLDLLIALQTNESAIRGTQPIVAISQ